MKVLVLAAAIWVFVSFARRSSWRVLVVGMIVMLCAAAASAGPYDPDRGRPWGSSSVDPRIPLRYVQPYPEPRVSPEPTDLPRSQEWGTRPSTGTRNGEETRTGR